MVSNLEKRITKRLELLTGRKIRREIIKDDERGHVVVLDFEEEKQ